MSRNLNDENDLQPVPGRLGLFQTPKSGRHAILPGVGMRKPDVIAPLAISGTGIGDELPDLDVPGRLPEDNPRQIRRAAPFADDPEKALAALIGECHFMMSEVAFRCIIQTSDAHERIAFMNAAMGFAKTGAKVAKVSAKLRAAPRSESHVAKLVDAMNRLDAKNAESGKQ